MKRLLLALCLAPVSAAAQQAAVQDGLAAWARIYEVASHPRCTNCHVGDSGRPGWAALGYGGERLHAMNVQGGESRIGAETMPCRTCHISAAGANDIPHAAPQIDDAWRLPPVGLAWAGKTSVEVCTQMGDHDSNDGFKPAELVEHIRESAFVNWGFKPGGGREPAPRTIEELAQNVALWGAAGTPCEDD